MNPAAPSFRGWAREHSARSSLVQVVAGLPSVPSAKLSRCGEGRRGGVSGAGCILFVHNPVLCEDPHPLQRPQTTNANTPEMAISSPLLPPALDPPKLHPQDGLDETALRTPNGSSGYKFPPLSLPQATPQPRLRTVLRLRTTGREVSVWTGLGPCILQRTMK